MTFKKEVENLIVNYLKNYYERHVKPLEIDHDELLRDNRKLRKQVNSLKKEIEELKSQSVVTTDYREIAIRLKRERDMYKKMLSERKYVK